MAGYDLPVRAIRQQVAAALDLIVQLERLQDGSRRVTAITEVGRMESDVITMQDIFEFKVEEVTSDGRVVGALQHTGLRPAFLHEVREARRGVPRRIRKRNGRAQRARGGSGTGAVRDSPALLALAGPAPGRRAPRRRSFALPRSAPRAFPTARTRSRSPRARACRRSGCGSRRTGSRFAGLGVAGQGRRRTLGVVLVIDASNSMRGRADRGRDGGRTRLRPPADPDQPLGIVTFNSRTDTLLPLTTDAEQIDSALAAEPQLRRQTHLYDGVDAALSMLAADDLTSGSVIVISDGADTGSQVALREAAARARAEGIRIFSVGLRSSAFKPEPLQTLAASSRGSYSEAGDAERSRADLPTGSDRRLSRTST